MIIINNYTTKTLENQIIVIKGIHLPLCPACEQRLKVIGTRQRVAYQAYGTREVYRIRRLRCAYCERIHHELPDFLVPYKRHVASTIEEVLVKGTTTSACDESTIRRWLGWWLVFAHAIFQTLLRVLDDQKIDTAWVREKGAERLLEGGKGSPSALLSYVVHKVNFRNFWNTYPFRLSAL
ncbi:MAG: DUF6431 domain-containing protein [Bacilli bacterium]